MLSTIKDMINNKKEMLESASTIYEDVIDDIENYIIEDADDELVDGEGKPEDNDKSEDSKDEDTDDIDEDDEIGDGLKPDNLENGDHDVDDLDDLDDVSLDEDMGDITNVELNIATNNVADVLPVPPMNAADAVVSDTMNTSVDDGFDDEPIIGATMESFDDGWDDLDLFNEAITIDASVNDKPEDTKSEDEVPDESATNTEENNVTSAVLDKVNDVNTDTNSEKDSKDKLLDKLDKLNRGILDLKENIKKHIS